jgi:hypothetical protein
MAGEGCQRMAARCVCKDVQWTTKALQSPCRRRGSQSYSQKRLLKTAEESSSAGREAGRNQLQQKVVGNRLGCKEQPTG